MKQEISVSKNFCRGTDSHLVIGTHSGIFHSDDVVAVALFCVNNEDRPIHVVRSRDVKELEKCDILVDVGNGRYDHHQIGGNGARDNKIPYASAGLYWKYHGKEIIAKLAPEISDSIPSQTFIDNSFDILDQKLFQEIDKEDNGIPTNSTPLYYISSYLPMWQVVNKSSDAYETSFKSVLTVSISILKQLIIAEMYELACGITIIEEYKQFGNVRILEIPAQTFPWTKPVVTLNEQSNAGIDFVIFPYSAGGWAAQCVPPNLTEKFKQRVSFPSNWAGETTKLPEISGVSDATFCHNGLFFARAKSREGIIAMCSIAYAK